MEGTKELQSTAAAAREGEKGQEGAAASAAAAGSSLLGSVLVSERHAYKYRCSQCSLAFKTAEKLALHSQYHVIRDATRCRLCSRDDMTFTAFDILGALLTCHSLEL